MFDHKRAAAAKIAGINVKAIIYDASELLPADFAVSRFLKNRSKIAMTWEDAINFRILKQSKGVQDSLRNGLHRLEYR